MGRERRAAGDHELRRQLDPVHVAVDQLLELGRHLGGDAADAVDEPLGGLGRRRELGAGDEQVVLEAEDVGGELGLVGAAERAGDAERRGRLVEGAVGLGARVGLRHPAAVPERGGPVVALLRVDPGHGADPSAPGEPDDSKSARAGTPGGDAIRDQVECRRGPPLRGPRAGGAGRGPDLACQGQAREPGARPRPSMLRHLPELGRQVLQASRQTPRQVRRHGRLPRSGGHHSSCRIINRWKQDADGTGIYAISKRCRPA